MRGNPSSRASGNRVQGRVHDRDSLKRWCSESLSKTEISRQIYRVQGWVHDRQTWGNLLRKIVCVIIVNRSSIICESELTYPLSYTLFCSYLHPTRYFAVRECAQSCSYRTHPAGRPSIATPSPVFNTVGSAPDRHAQPCRYRTHPQSKPAQSSTAGAVLALCPSRIQAATKALSATRCVAVDTCR